MGGPCSTNGGEEEAYGLLVGKPEGKRPLGRPRRRWVDNIRMDLGEVSDVLSRRIPISQHYNIFPRPDLIFFCHLHPCLVGEGVWLTPSAVIALVE
jgi:hypothetical protein